MKFVLWAMVTILSHFASSTRIVGGDNARLGQFPYQLGVRFDGKHRCAASLVVLPGTDYQFAVSSAHCFYNYEERLPARRFSLYGGSLSSSNPTQVIKVTRFATHYTFQNRFTGRADISVVFFQQGFNLSENLSPIKLDSDGSYEGNLLISGWGAVQFQGPLVDTLQYAQVITVPYDTCQEAYNEVGGAIYKDMNICAGEEGKDSCAGDSGGPAMGYRETNEPLLIGTVSWGHKCAEPGFPGIYTSVSYYYQWIISQALIFSVIGK